MFLKLYSWIFIVGLFVSGLNYDVTVQALYRDNGTTTEQIIQQQQESPAANFCAPVHTPATFAVLNFENFYFPSFLDLHNNRVDLQLKQQFNIFSQQENFLLQQALFARVRTNPLFD